MNQDLVDRVRQIPCEELTLDVGDLLIFRGDFIHAGSSYEEDNYHLHTFLDSEVVKRQPNETWLVHTHGAEALKKLILPLSK